MKRVASCRAVVVAALLVLFSTARTPGASASEGDWYATFTYAGKTYAFSHAYSEAPWSTVVGADFANAVNSAPDGNAGNKGQAWCNDVLITEGPDDQYGDWFLPNFDEMLAGRNGYQGGDPLDVAPPPHCQVDASIPLRALWTATSCSTGSTAAERAYFIFPLSTQVVDADVLEYMACENDGAQSHWCCFDKQDYTPMLACPLARCVRVVTEAPTDGPSSTPTRTPMPTTAPPDTPVETPTRAPTDADTPPELPTAAPTSTQGPTAAPPYTPTPTTALTHAPMPTATGTEAPLVTPTSAPRPTPTATHTPTPISTPRETPVPTVTATQAPTAPSIPILSGALPAFPGAEGFGADTPGGRGGQVIEVTNLNDSGTGSLRACVEASGARVCVFRTGGTIELESPLEVSNPYITIAGQTAPGGGITLRHASGETFYTTLTVETHDVIMRYLTIRRGPGGGGDALGMYSERKDLYNIIVDHCSFSWGVDEVFSTWFDIHDYTLSWCIFSEGLDCSTHPEGCHSAGVTLGSYAGNPEKTDPGAYNITLHHSLMTQNVHRNPLVKGVKVCDIVNNVVYNPRGSFSHVDMDQQTQMVQVNYVGNYFKSGPQSEEKRAVRVISPGPYGAGVYVEDNVIKRRSGAEITDVVDPRDVEYIVSTRYDAPYITTTSPHTAYGQVLSDAGANKGIRCDGTWFDRRDAHDARVISDVQNVTGNWINDPSEVGGWLDIDEGTPCADTDHDGMPDAWETAYFGDLGRGSPSDSSGDYDGDGYTDLEEFLNGTDPTGGLPVPTSTPTQVPEATNTPTQAPTPTATPIQASTALTVGWNLVSVPISPVSTVITRVLSSINGGYDLVYAYARDGSGGTWKEYDVTRPPFLNSLTDIDESMGFWIRMTEATSLSAEGTEPETTAIELLGGWNLVGYPSHVTRPVAEALQSIDGEYSLVYAYHAEDGGQAWKTYDVTRPPYLNSLTDMEPWRGYWIHAIEDCTLTVAYD